jgi:hypothetical protein
MEKLAVAHRVEVRVHNLFWGTGRNRGRGGCYLGLPNVPPLKEGEHERLAVPVQRAAKVDDDVHDGTECVSHLRDEKGGHETFNNITIIGNAIDNGETGPGIFRSNRQYTLCMKVWHNEISTDYISESSTISALYNRTPLLCIHQLQDLQQ